MAELLACSCTQVECRACGERIDRQPELARLAELEGAVTRIADSMRNSSGSPHITADTEHHLKHWAGKLEELLEVPGG